MLLRSMIDPKDFDKLFPPTPKTQGQPVSAHSISDIQQCLQDAQISYECRVQHADDSFRNIAPIVTGFGQPSTTTLFNKSKVKARLWLVGLSEKLMYYGNIFDVMAQHHPEYVSLAWGTFKLVFIVRSIPYRCLNCF